MRIKGHDRIRLRLMGIVEEKINAEGAEINVFQGDRLGGDGQSLLPPVPFDLAEFLLQRHQIEVDVMRRSRLNDGESLFQLSVGGR